MHGCFRQADAVRTGKAFAERGEVYASAFCAKVFLVYGSYFVPARLRRGPMPLFAYAPVDKASRAFLHVELFLAAEVLAGVACPIRHLTERVLALNKAVDVFFQAFAVVGVLHKKIIEFF